MSNYQGPNVAVEQTFSSAPGAVAVEGLPAAIIGTSYEVFENDSVGEVGSAFDTILKYNTDKKVVFDKTVAGQRILDFYAPTVVVSTNGAQYPVDNATFSATGISIPKNLSYDISGTVLSASMPYFGTDSAVSTVVGGKVVLTQSITGYEIFAGLEVIRDGVSIGRVKTVSTDGLTIELETAATNDATAKKIVIGATSTAPTVANTILLNSPISSVKTGDIIKFTSNISGVNVEYKASVKRVFNNGYAIEINTEASYTTDVSYLDISKVFGFTASCGGSTVVITSVKAARLAGFAKFISNVAFTAVVGENKLTVAAGTASVGDTVKIGTSYFKVIGVNPARTNVFISGVATATSGNYDHFKTTVSSQIRASYRAINVGEVENVRRITGLNDVEKYFGTVSPFNELAFMASQALAGNGGKVIYAFNLSSAIATISAEYTKALAAMKMFDVYSHAFGTDFSIASSVLSYVSQQSESYQAHERIARLTYEQKSLYALGEVNGTYASGVLTMVAPAGTDIDDIVILKDSAGKTLATTKVVGTPGATSVQVKPVTFTGSVASAEFSIGTAFAKSQRVKALGALSNRRAKIICPGYFTGTVNGKEMTLPPYFITAYYAGLDDGQKPSQSFTNLGVAIGSITNISLATDTYWDVDLLDEIGSGGIDIIVQDGITTTNVVKSRHDLTTDMEDVLTREWSITKQVDISAKTLRGVARKFIGVYNITPELIKNLKASLVIAAGALVDGKNISGLTIVSINRDEKVADKIVIGVKGTVFVAGNYYDITINVGV